MTGLIAVLLIAALIFWMFGRRPAPRAVAPEDDVSTPIDEDALAEAEAELEEDDDPRQADDEDDDWGPGAGRR